MTMETPLIWVVWLLAGAMTGFLSNRILRARYPLLLDLVVGAVGGVLGGLLFALTGAVGAIHFNPLSVMLAVSGAGVILALLHLTGIGRKLLSK